MGQLMITSDVENYPGFPKGIMGPELMQQFREQAERFGADDRRRATSTRVDFSQRPFRMWVGDDEYGADAVIVATGASAMWLGLPSEDALRGHGVSACATCDGFFFRGQRDRRRRRRRHRARGGDVPHPLRQQGHDARIGATSCAARKIMQERAARDPKIEIVWNSRGRRGEGRDDGQLARPCATRRPARRPSSTSRACSSPSATSRTPTCSPASCASDEGGYLEVVDETGSGIEGVFVAGDVHDHRYRQAVTAAGDGCKAAIDAERWLASVGEIEASTATNW